MHPPPPPHTHTYPTIYMYKCTLFTNAHLDEPLLEEYLGGLFEYWQQARVVDPYASLQQGKDMLHLRQLLIIVRETVDGVSEYLLNQGLLISCMEEKGDTCTLYYIPGPVVEW